MRRYPYILALALTLTGCATLDELGINPRATTADQQLVFAGQLMAAEPGELDAIGERLQEETANGRTPIDALRYALWQATPGHEGHDPEAARERLNALLADGRPPSALAALIRIELHHLDLLAERAQLRADVQRLSAANRERQSQIEGLEQEIQGLQEQIQALTTLERRMGGSGDEGSGD